MSDGIQYIIPRDWIVSASEEELAEAKQFGEPFCCAEYNAIIEGYRYKGKTYITAVMV